jgi:HKD family nuclease
VRKKPLIRIGTIQDSGPNTLIAFLRNAGAACDQIDIAAAFITESGLNSLFYVLKRAASRGHVRVLTGLFQGFTDPKALWALFKEQERTGGRLSVRVSSDRHFHWKAYFLLKRNAARVVIGSSNLTDDGLHEPGELNVVLSLDTESNAFVELRQVYDRHWERKGKELTAEVITKYASWRKEAGIGLKPRAVPIREILGPTALKKEVVKTDRVR